MKRLIKIAAIVGLLAAGLAGAALIAGLNLGGMLTGAVNSHGPKLLKTDVRLGAAEVRLLAAQVRLKDMYIGNPPGFSLPKLLSARSVVISFARTSLLGNPLVIDRLELDSPDICYEKTATTDNFKALVKNMHQPPAGTTADQAETKASAPKNKKKTRIKVLIRTLVIKNARVTAIMRPLGDKKLSLRLPELRLNNVGGRSGARPDTIARLVLAALYKNILAGSDPVSRILGITGDAAQCAGQGVQRTFDRASRKFKKLFGK